MKKSNLNPRKHTGPRPDYIDLAEDANDASHVYRTTDETIHVAQDGERVQKFVLGTRTVDDHVKFVRDEVNEREWANRRYVADDEDPFAALVDQIADAIEVAA